MKRLLSVLALVLLLGAMLPLSVVLASPGLTTTDLNSGKTPADLVNDLLGGGVSVSNITFAGANIAAGTFAGGTGIIGFESGIILSSGDIFNVIGPNINDGITTINNRAGDADLNVLVAPHTTLDAAVLEFDFIPENDTVQFDYVFSSDEYNEYVHSSFNDVFGFFVNGTNYALIPGTNTPVAINNVNNGNPYNTDPRENPEFYRNNDIQDGGGLIDTEMDGLTTVFTLTAEVNAGVTNHMKLAIADTSDLVLDSAVFIKGGSFISVPDLYLEPTDATNKIGETHELTATYTVDDEPVPGVLVHFEVIEGPHTGANGNATTNESGVATWSYSGSIIGTDKIKASIDMVDPDPDVISNTVTKTWVENGTPPGPEVGGRVYPTNKLIILTPIIVLAIVVTAGMTILIRRRQKQS